MTAMDYEGRILNQVLKIESLRKNLTYAAKANRRKRNALKGLRIKYAMVNKNCNDYFKAWFITICLFGLDLLYQIWDQWAR